MIKSFFRPTRKIYFLPAAFALFTLVLSGCTLAPGNSSPKSGNNGNNGTSEITSPDSSAQKSFILPVNEPYKYGMPYAPASLNNTSLLSEYNDWINHYVICPDGYRSRVQRDAATGYDTVSEGMGYGLLLSVYFGDHDNFYRLYSYVLMHTNGQGLMHWRVDRYGNNIDEMGYNIPSPPPHQNLYTNGTPVATNSDGTVVQSSILQSTTAPAGYGLYENSRGLTSASDADEDIALALCMAAKVWGTWCNYNYQTEALNWIGNIMKYDMHPGWQHTDPASDGTVFLGAGDYDNGGSANGTWGGYKYEANNGKKAGWDPSYYMPAWYPIFKQLTGDPLWDQLTNTMWQQCAIVGAANSGTGLFPDWCDTSSGTCQQTVWCSDRGPQSYNFYYDAVRVPWRMAVAASWFNDQKALAIAGQNAVFFKQKMGTTFNANNILDGYSITGGAWQLSKADPGSAANGGQNPNPPVFVSMIAPAELPCMDVSYANAFYIAVTNCKIPYTAQYNYFGNTLRLLSLLYLSGNFVNLYEQNPYTAKPTHPVPGTIYADDNYTINGVNYLATNIGGVDYIKAGCTAVFLVSNTEAAPYSMFTITPSIMLDPKMPPGTYASPYYPYYYCYVDGVLASTSTIQLTPGVHTITFECHAYVYLKSINFTYLKDSPYKTIPGTIDLNNYIMCFSAGLSANNPNCPSLPLVVSMGAPYSGTPYVEYDVNAPSAGTYTISIPVYNNYFANNNISITSGSNLLGKIGPIPNSSSVQTFSTTITLSAGVQPLRFSSAYDCIGPITIN